MLDKATLRKRSTVPHKLSWFCAHRRLVLFPLQNCRSVSDSITDWLRRQLFLEGGRGTSKIFSFVPPPTLRRKGPSQPPLKTKVLRIFPYLDGQKTSPEFLHGGVFCPLLPQRRPWVTIRRGPSRSRVEGGGGGQMPRKLKYHIGNT